MTMKIQSPNPDCKQDCRFTKGAEFTSSVYFQPLYDKQGNLISKDNNTVSGSVDCIICGKHWTFITSHGKTHYTEWPQQQK